MMNEASKIFIEEGLKILHFERKLSSFLAELLRLNTPNQKSYAFTVSLDIQV